MTAADLKAIEAQLAGMDFGEGATLDEGGGLPSFTLTITDAIFGTDAQYNDGGTTLLKLTGTDSENDKDRTILWSVGGKFEATRDGSRVAHSDNPKRNFNLKSTIGQHIHRMTRNAKFPGVVESARYWSTRDFREAANWKGLTFAFGDVEMIKFVEGGAEEKKMGHGPTAFVTGESKSPTAKSPAAKAPAASDKMAEAFAAIDGDRAGEIVAWAQTMATKADFMAGAKTAAPELMKDKALAAGLFSGALYAMLTGK